MADALPKDFAITALSTEAIRRGISYGNLVAATTAEERLAIVKRYERKWRTGRKRG